MACFGGGTTIHEDNANKYEKERKNINFLHVWFCTKSKHPNLMPAEMEGYPNLQEKIDENERLKHHDRYRGETASTKEKLLLKDAEARLCNAIHQYGEREFWSFLDTCGIRNKNATTLANWYQDHKEIDEKRKMEADNEFDEKKRDNQTKEITTLFSELPTTTNQEILDELMKKYYDRKSDKLMEKYYDRKNKEK